MTGALLYCTGEMYWVRLGSFGQTLKQARSRERVSRLISTNPNVCDFQHPVLFY